MRSVWFALVPLAATAVSAVACEEPPPQDPSDTQTTYQNGYPQTIAQANGQPGQPGQPQAQPSTTGTAGVMSAPTATAPTAQPAQAAPTALPPGSWGTPQPQQAPQQEPIQTTPVPVGIQPAPPPANGVQTAPSPTAPAMAVPGPGAFVCSSDAQCLLGRCNLRYGRCAYPCRSSALDCKPGNVCSAAGLCMPRIAGGVGM